MDPMTLKLASLRIAPVNGSALGALKFHAYADSP